MVAQLLADLNARGIKLAPHGDRLRFSPRGAMTPELAERLRTHKVEVLAHLAGEDPKVEDVPVEDNALEDNPVEDPAVSEEGAPQPEAVCRCGSVEVRDVVLLHPPHHGRSTRRDCARCGRFLGFGRWHGAGGEQEGGGNE